MIANEPGVVYCSGDGVVHCATCRKQKFDCVHVQTIHNLVKQPLQELPDCLQTFALPPESKPPRKEAYSSVVSTKKIPFHTSQTLAEVFKQPLVDRFNMQNGLFHLQEAQVPDPVCRQCGLSIWAEDIVCYKSMVVTHNDIIPARCNSMCCNFIAISSYINFQCTTRPV